MGVSVSLPRLGGWRDQSQTSPGLEGVCFSLVAEIGWLASRRRTSGEPLDGNVSVSLPRLGGWRVRIFPGCPPSSTVSVSLPRLGGWRAIIPSRSNTFMRVSVSLPRLGGWRVLFMLMFMLMFTVSVSLPRLGGWRVSRRTRLSKGGWFQSRCRDWVVGEIAWAWAWEILGCFSLVAEIGWLASLGGIRDGLVSGIVSVSLPRLGGWRGGGGAVASGVRLFQSRCRDWVVGESRDVGETFFQLMFQSRCRDWVVGEHRADGAQSHQRKGVSVSLPRLGGWRATGFVASPHRSNRFQSRCRDWVVGEAEAY